VTIIEAHNICVMRDRSCTLNEVNFSLNAGELVGIVGPNGSGKSTLLRTLCGLQKTASGSILIEGANLRTIAQRTLARFIGYLPQQAVFHWPISVRHAVAMGRFPYQIPTFAVRPEDAAAIDAAIIATSLEAFVDNRVDRLSGGEQVRVHLARLLAGGHRVSLADEPITSLDVKFQLDLLALLKHEVDNGVAVVISLHDLTLASRFCDRIVVLDHGEIVVDGAPGDALSDEILTTVFGVSAERVATGEGVLLVPRREPERLTSARRRS
jgi:iron complex transport system ATP-binding protein